MPHGVVPPAQLLSVPSTTVPVGSSWVRSRGEPAAGPLKVIGVLTVIRRFSGAPTTYCHGSRLRPRASSTTDMPCAAMPMRRCSASCSGLVAGGNMTSSFVYSWFVTSTPLRPFGASRMSR